MRLSALLAQALFNRALRALLMSLVGLPAGAFAARVNYDYGALVFLDTPPPIEQLADYKPLLFDGEVAQLRAISAAVSTSQYTCPLAFQDAAAAFSSEADQTVAVMGFRACPFELKYLFGERWVKLRDAITIDIEKIADGVVYVSARSAVPFVAERTTSPFPSPTAIGVTWRFPRAGARFRTVHGEFVTGRANATIQFTARGPRFSGFSRFPRQAGSPGSTNGWAREIVRVVQEQLISLGYRPGPVDGLWGNRTRDAIAKFQRDRGIDSTGKLDGATLDRLGL
ncbi:MAG: hypothetical protein GKR94_27805 [Gammaproteobacteria bacterium]|nr:hypothetical protein [Gammaproteobacteria bacterium]